MPTVRSTVKAAPGLPPTSPANCPWATVLAGVLLVVCAALAYANSLHGPFVLDDLPAIPENPTITHLWPLLDGGPLTPPPDGQTVTGRPLVNLTLALDYNNGGLEVESYHRTNLVIHILAGLTLFGLARRTLSCPRLRDTFGSVSLGLGLAVALVWTLHPLQIDAVTYIVQRAEAMMALFYLLTLYFFSCSVDSLRPRLWQGLAVGACLLGMASKEVMVSAPLMVLLYDRTFVAGSVIRALRLRKWFYLLLASTWILLGWLVFKTGTRGQSAGFNTEMDPFDYAMTQGPALVHYLRLAIWPHPLVFDYGDGLITNVWQVAPASMFVILLVVLTLVSVWRWPVAGFFGAAFFALLAPTSSIMPVVTQTIAEHRMYLPLAALVALAIPALYREYGRPALYASFLVAAAFGWMTHLRNADYQSEEKLWGESARVNPGNARAHRNYGMALANAASKLLQGGQTQAAEQATAAALAQFQLAEDLRPTADLQNNWGNVLLGEGRRDEAVVHYRRAVVESPKLTDAHYNLGNAYASLASVSPTLEQRRIYFEKARHEYEAAVKCGPTHAPAHNNLGNVYEDLGAMAGDLQLLRRAEAEFRTAFLLQPEFADAHSNLGNLLMSLQRYEEAAYHYGRAAEINPRSPSLLNCRGVALYDSNRPVDAVRCFEKALTLDPNNQDAKHFLEAVRQQIPQGEK